MTEYCISSTAQRISFASVEEDRENLLPHNDPLPKTTPNLNKREEIQSLNKMFVFKFTK